MFKYLYFDGFFGYLIDKLILKFEFYWFGSIMKYMFVGVDIVFGVLMLDWRLKEFIIDIYICFDDEQFFLIFYLLECS